jgi:hypothetical protein
MRYFILLALVLIGQNVQADCFNNICGKRVVVNAAHVYPSVYYVPGAPYQYGTYKSDSQQIYEQARRAVADELDARKVGEVSALSGGLVVTKCGKCHSSGKPNEASFSIEGEWTAEKALKAQKAFLGVLDGIPNMAEKAGVQGDGDAIKKMLIEFTKLPEEGAGK